MEGEFERQQASGSKIAWLPLAAKLPLQKELAGAGGGFPTAPGCGVGVRVLFSMVPAKGCPRTNPVGLTCALHQDVEDMACVAS